jgi:hypothetical protein
MRAGAGCAGADIPVLTAYLPGRAWRISLSRAIGAIYGHLWPAIMAVVSPDTPPGIREAAGIPVTRPAVTPVTPAGLVCVPATFPADLSRFGDAARHAYKAVGHERKRDVATGESGQAGRRGPGRHDPITPDNPHSVGSRRRRLASASARVGPRRRPRRRRLAGSAR